MSPIHLETERSGQRVRDGTGCPVIVCFAQAASKLQAYAENTAPGCTHGVFLWIGSIE